MYANLETTTHIEGLLPPNAAMYEIVQWPANCAMCEFASRGILIRSTCSDLCGRYFQKMRGGRMGYHNNNNDEVSLWQSGTGGKMIVLLGVGAAVTALVLTALAICGSL